MLSKIFKKNDSDFMHLNERTTPYAVLCVVKADNVVRRLNYGKTQKTYLSRLIVSGSTKLHVYLFCLF